MTLMQRFFNQSRFGHLLWGLDKLFFSQNFDSPKLFCFGLKNVESFREYLVSSFELGLDVF